MTKRMKRKKKFAYTAISKWRIALFICGVICIFEPGICAEAAQAAAGQATEAVSNDESSQAAGMNQKSAEVTELNQIMVADKTALMKAEPDLDSETLMTYEEGALVFVIGETAEGWYYVTYQDKEGYIQKELLSMQEIDVEGLNAEMAVNEEEGRLVVEAVEKYRAEAKRSKIWGSIIIVLVVGIFAVGIFSALKTQKSEGEGNANKRKRQIKIEDWN